MDYLIGAIGDLTVDTILPSLPVLPQWGQEMEIGTPVVRLGGNIGNMAVGAGALKTNLYVSAFVGKDGKGEFIIDRLKDMGLPLEGIAATDRKKTSESYACVRTDGERFLLTYKGTLDLMEDLALAGHIPDTKVVFLGGWCLPPRVNPQRLARQICVWQAEGRVVSTDLIWSEETWAHREQLLEILSNIDILFMNEKELLALTGKGDFGRAVEVLRGMLFQSQHKERLSVIKLGAKGAALLSQRGCCFADAYPVAPVDTVGAGDLFNIGFLHALYQMKLNREQSLKFASHFASIAISRYHMDLPTEAEICHSMKPR